MERNGRKEVGKRPAFSMQMLFYEARCLQFWHEEIMPLIRESISEDFSTIDSYVQGRRWGSLRELMEQRSIRHIDSFIALFNVYKVFEDPQAKFSLGKYFDRTLPEYKSLPFQEKAELHGAYSAMRNSMKILREKIPDGISLDLPSEEIRALHPDERAYFGLASLFDRMEEINTGR